MKVLFLDDSFNAEKNYQGYGGFCIDADNIHQLSDEIQALKRRKRIPWDVELKWSPSRNHYLRNKYKGSRNDLYREALAILRQNKAQLFCAIHDLKQCYGVTEHGWNKNEARLWATKEQLKYLTERFQRTILKNQQMYGLIISDNYASRRGEKAIVKQATADIVRGTIFQKFDYVSLVPLMADSKYCFPIQLADLVTGITVAFFAKGKYGLELFPDIVDLFAYNPHQRSISFSSIYSESVIGVGIKLFPRELKREVKDLLDDLDKKYLVAISKGIYMKINK